LTEGAASQVTNLPPGEYRALGWAEGRDEPAELGLVTIVPDDAREAQVVLTGAGS
jgi:hypothetical protein